MKSSYGEKSNKKDLDGIKEYLNCPPVLMPPQKEVPFRLYLSADVKSIGSVLIREIEGKKEIYFILAEGFWMHKQGIPRWKSCDCAYIFHVPS